MKNNYILYILFPSIYMKIVYNRPIASMLLTIDIISTIIVANAVIFIYQIISICS